MVDAAGSEGRDPVEDFMSLKEELRLYDGELAGKPAFVVANKTDLPGEIMLLPVSARVLSSALLSLWGEPGDF